MNNSRFKITWLDFKKDPDHPENVIIEKKETIMANINDCNIAEFTLDLQVGGMVLNENTCIMPSCILKVEHYC
jgi:hypothetical protein